MDYLVGVDTGGTFTDAVLVDKRGEMWTGKASTTPAGLKQGVIESLEVIADKTGLELRDILGADTVVSVGTTQGLNTLITRTGAKVGFLTTRGFEDTLLIGRGKLRIAGLSEEEFKRMPLTHKPEPLVPRDLTRGVEERIDMFGEVVQPLKEESVRQALGELVKEGAQIIVVSLLWGFLNPAHELRIREIAAETIPGTDVLLASEVCPATNEYPRGMTCVINGYIYPHVREFLGTLGRALEDSGYEGELMTMTNAGGASRWDLAHPVYTINSGPVGGMKASLIMAREYGLPNVVTTDVGGTSFDLGVIRDGHYTSERIRTDPPVIDRYHVLAPMIDIVSIGSGGGTVAWRDDLSGTIKVGPRSAGADPGPVAYGRGGQEPTVTDADIVLGRLNSDYFLGGAMQLNPTLAFEAVARVGEPLGLGAVETAAGILRIADSGRADLIIKNMYMRGYEPSEFTCFAFGGGGPTHACDYSRLAGLSGVLCLDLASVWSAIGVAMADIVHLHQLSKPMPLPFPYEEYNDTFRALEEEASRTAKLEGIADEDLVLEHKVNMKYGRTAHDITLHAVPGRLSSQEELEDLERQFHDRYAEVYGKEAIVPGAAIELSQYLIEVTGLRHHPGIPKHAAVAGQTAEAAKKGSRPVWFEDTDFVDTSVYDSDRLATGAEIDGPSIVEAQYTTVVVPPGAHAVVDEYKNFSISW